jgi:hypothetical protein
MIGLVVFSKVSYLISQFVKCLTRLNIWKNQVFGLCPSSNVPKKTQHSGN